MPDLAIFVIGALVTVVAVMACRAVGRWEEQDARDQQRQEFENASRNRPPGSP